MEKQETMTYQKHLLEEWSKKVTISQSSIQMDEMYFSGLLREKENTSCGG